MPYFLLVIIRKNCLYQSLRRENDKSFTIVVQNVLCCYRVSASARYHKRKGEQVGNQGGKKGKKKRERENEEEWEKYKETNLQRWGQGKEIKKSLSPIKICFNVQIYAFIFIKIWSNASSSIVFYPMCHPEYNNAQVPSMLHWIGYLLE